MLSRNTALSLPPSISFDSNALAYISAVETADGQALETAVKNAINTFVVGCKSDGTWNSIKASCILSGARTLSGALIPLVGTAPTNNNFVSGDYNRKTGLVGNGSTKYLNSNRTGSADPQNNCHLSIWKNDTVFQVNPYYIGAFTLGYLTGSGVGQGGMYSNSSTSFSSPNNAVGLYGYSRNTSSGGTFTTPGNNIQTFSVTSATPPAFSHYVFNLNNGGTLGTLGTTSRFVFYSIGEAIDLALLNTRLIALINTFAAVIP